MIISFFRFLFFGFTLLLSTTILAQSGNWNPAGANLSYPRTLTTISELDSVRFRLPEPERLLLYNQVFSHAFTAIPTNNSSSSDRRNRAKLAKNAAFILLINRQSGAGISHPLTSAQQQLLKATVKTLLQNLNTSVETVFNHTEWQWRSKELIDYLIAYDLLRGAGEPADSLLTEKARLQQFTGNLYSASHSWGNLFFSLTKNNHTLMTAAALGMAAVVLNDATSTLAAQRPQNWINAGMYHIDNVLWRDARRQSEPGKLAGYAEGPYYFRYAFINCLPFIRAMGHFLPAGGQNYTWNNITLNIQNPYYDPNYDLLYQWIAAITMPDGRFPALEDSFIDMGMPELALADKPQYVKPLWLQNLASNQSNTLSKQLTHIVDMRAAWLCTLGNPTTASDTLVMMPLSGNLIFRSGTDHNANYFHLYGKSGKVQTNSGGHNQADATSFSLYSNGQLLALDPGYLSYNMRAELGNAANHNMILVNGSGPSIGSAGSANEPEAFIQNTLGDSLLAIGEVKTNYNGASITRKAISVRGEYYILADFASSSASPTYTWQLHGYGLESGTAATGIYVADFANKQATWQKNGVSLAATVTATGGTANYSTRTAAHELTYETKQDHSVMQVEQTGSSTGFLSVLQPYVTQPRPVAVLTLPGATAMVVTAGNGNQELTLAKADTGFYQLQQSNHTISAGSDAIVTFLSIDTSGNTSQILIQDGTKLQVDGEDILLSSERATVLWTELANNQVSAYVSKPTTLQIRTNYIPQSIIGADTWSTEKGVLTISVSKPTLLQVQYQQTPLPVNLITFTAKAVGNKAIIEWKTASEKENNGYQILASADGHTYQSLGWKYPQNNNSAVPQQYLYEDARKEKTGAIYYKLLQHDTDGTINNLGVRAVQFQALENTVEIQVFPNPFYNDFTLVITNIKQEVIEIEISDSGGKILYRQTHPPNSMSNTIVVKPSQVLPKGVLICTVKTSQGVYSEKIISL